MTKKTIKKSRTQTINILISTGYVEDSANGWLWWNFTTDLTDPKAIRQKLGDIMVDYHETDNGTCTCDSLIPPDTKFCPDCGTKMITKDAIGLEAIELTVDMIREFNTSSCSEVDQEWVYYMERNGVKLWGHPVNGLMIKLYSFDCWLEKRWGEMDCAGIKTFKNVKFK